MIRVRAYRYVLALPLLLVIFALGFSLVSDGYAFEVGGGLFLAGLVLQIVFAVSFACPSCGKSPYAVGPHFGPFAFAGKPWAERTCSKCGHKFD